MCNGNPSLKTPRVYVHCCDCCLNTNSPLVSLISAQLSELAAHLHFYTEDSLQAIHHSQRDAMINTFYSILKPKWKPRIFQQKERENWQSKISLFDKIKKIQKSIIADVWHDCFQTLIYLMHPTSYKCNFLSPFCQSFQLIKLLC